MSLHQQLLEQARHLARRERKRPLQASLRRSISATYYGLFHYLIERATRQVFGSAIARKQMRDILSRAFEHASMKDASKAFASGGLPTSLGWSFPIPSAVRVMANSFVELQSQRHSADYNVGTSFTRTEVLQLISQTEHSIALWPSIESDDSAQLYLVCLLTWKTLRNR